jgi:hypothetical protein
MDAQRSVAALHQSVEVTDAPVVVDFAGITVPSHVLRQVDARNPSP